VGGWLRVDRWSFAPQAGCSDATKDGAGTWSGVIRLVRPKPIAGTYETQVAAAQCSLERVNRIRAAKHLGGPRVNAAIQSRRRPAQDRE